MTAYLGIWYSMSDSEKVWVGNETHLLSTIRVLTIDGVGKLIITHNGGDPIELYGGLTAPTWLLLLDSQFHCDMANNNGSKKTVLWESFYYPTDTLLPHEARGQPQDGRSGQSHHG
ncbi:G-type lectin S-receptor-like serine/threonine-protein kinase [Camellia lanceoleosa]|uniref:G-type lectin S-receptor-like serine/threonine-protein kinase n=1 Tax=Camellia lanceoleosa TaxID=1840588 RepID=A0ACC0GZB0_9ERIC|nr:G-type lectin S-receptor-like serine/threonine-protein kinase [Camellia lanceoleosa]